MISQNIFRRCDRTHFRLQSFADIFLPTVHARNLCFFVFARIVRHELEHEAIELRFGQVVSSFAFDRILRGEDQERAFNDVRSCRRP